MQNKQLVVESRSAAITNAGHWQIAHVDDLSSSWPFGAAGRFVACQQPVTIAKSANCCWSFTRNEIDQGGSANLNSHDNSRVGPYIHEQCFHNLAWGRRRVLKMDSHIENLVALHKHAGRFMRWVAVLSSARHCPRRSTPRQHAIFADHVWRAVPRYFLPKNHNSERLAVR